MNSDAYNPPRFSKLPAPSCKRVRYAQGLGCSVIVAALSCQLALAQDVDIPRTEHGHPDFQGFTPSERSLRLIAHPNSPTRQC